MHDPEWTPEDSPGEDLSQDLLRLKEQVALSWEALSREFHRVMGEEGPSNTTLFRYATGRVSRKNPMVERYVRDAIHKISIELVQRELSESETRRKRVEQNLEQTEVRFRKMVEHARDVIFRYRLLPTPGFEYLSPAVFDVVGYTPQEYYADSELAIRIVHPDDRSIVEAHLKDEIGFDEALTIRWIHKDGSIVWVEESKVPIYNEEGSLLAVEGVVRDVTERRRAEKDNLYLAAIVDSSNDAIIGATTDSIVASWNRAAEKLLGYKAEEIIGQHISVIHPPDEPGLSQRIHGRLVNGELVKFADTVRINKDGRPINVSVTTSAIRDQQGQIIGFSGILQDISERKLNETKLQEAQKRLEQVVHSSPGGTYSHKIENDTLTLTFISKNITDQWGYEEHEYLQKDWWQSNIHPDDRERILRDYPENLIEGAAEPSEYRFRHKDGSYRWIRDQTNLIRDEEGNPVEVVGAWLDISEQKQREQAFAESFEKYRGLVENIQDEYFLYSHNLDGHFTYVSPSITNILGYSQEEFLTHYIEYVTNDKIAEVVRHTQQSLRGKQQPSYKFGIFHKDGRVRTLRVLEAPVLDGEGKVIAVEGIAHDITDIAGMQA